VEQAAMSQKNERIQVKNVTSYCVAKEAGVSQSAVSRAYNLGGSISESTRRKVEIAAKKLGYKPNAIARSLISKSSNIIAIVMADIVNPFYPNVLDIFVRKLQDRGHKGMLFMVDRDQDVDEVLPQLMEYQVDGVVITSATLSSEMADRCMSMGTPVALFNRYVPSAKAISICCDDVGSARKVADFLYSSGARRLAFIAGVENTSTSRDREFGFTARVRELGLAPPARAVGSYTYEGGFEAALSLFSSSNQPDALFCANDLMALGAMDALRTELKLRIPEEVAIIGFDDIDNARWPVYGLTTVKPQVERMVELTLDKLMKQVSDQDELAHQELLPGDIIVRKTTRQPSGIA